MSIRKVTRKRGKGVKKMTIPKGKKRKYLKLNTKDPESEKSIVDVGKNNQNQKSDKPIQVYPDKTRYIKERKKNNKENRKSAELTDAKKPINTFIDILYNDLVKTNFERLLTEDVEGWSELLEYVKNNDLSQLDKSDTKKIVKVILQLSINLYNMPVIIAWKPIISTLHLLVKDEKFRSNKYVKEIFTENQLETIEQLIGFMVTVDGSSTESEETNLATLKELYDLVNQN